MVGWHHQLNGHEFEQTLGDSEGQGSLASCSPWGCKESDMTEKQNNEQQQESTRLPARKSDAQPNLGGGRRWGGWGLGREKWG